MESSLLDRARGVTGAMSRIPASVLSQPPILETSWLMHLSGSSLAARAMGHRTLALLATMRIADIVMLCSLPRRPVLGSRWVLFVVLLEYHANIMA